MFKKVLSLILAAALLCTVAMSLASCGKKGDDGVKGMSESPLAIPELKADFTVPENFKIGFICLHDESSTYDLNFINAVLRYQEALGLTNEQVIMKRQRSAMKQLLTLLARAATSSSQTPSVTSPTSLRLQKHILTFSSATQQA